jgi:hypothetical protein
MATERQIAANRRNARNSTGPRSSAGRKRASRNSYRHGLTARTASSTERARRVERLARKIARDSADLLTLESARAAAQAELDLAQIRQVKVALIGRMLAFGEFEAPQLFKSVGQIKQFLNAFDRGGMSIPEPVDAAATMPSVEPERLAEAVRRALPELLKFDRYECRAAIRRDRSLCEINDRILRNYNLK